MYLSVIFKKPYLYNLLNSITIFFQLGKNLLVSEYVKIILHRIISINDSFLVWNLKSYSAMMTSTMTCPLRCACINALKCLLDEHRMHIY